MVTSLLSLLDYSLATGQSVMAKRSVEEIREARRLLERGVLEVINDFEEFDADEDRQLTRFCQLMQGLNGGGSKSPLCAITTNYDMAADFAAFRCAKVERDADGYWDEDQIASRIDFGFDWLHPEADATVVYSRPNKPLLRLLKLHGSTNWLRCPLCDHIYVNPWGPIWDQAYRKKSDHLNRCHCTDTRLEAQIISPSFVREMRAPNLMGIWKSALDGLRMADRWLIIGYSFPDEDLAVRALFTRAYGSRSSPPTIAVIQHDRSAYQRYDAFFAPDNLMYCTGGLAAFLSTWSSSSLAPTLPAS
jgi:hypothetical protein